MSNYIPRINARERILTFGVQGVGKSIAPLSILRKTNTKAWAVDIDYVPSFERLLAEEFEDIADRVSVQMVEPDDWSGILNAVDEAKSNMGRDDWLIVDSISHTWPAVRSWFIEQVHGKDIDEYFMEVRKKKQQAKQDSKALGALEGWMDWPVINKSYFKLYSKIASAPGHLYITAEADRIGPDDDPRIKGRFGPYGMKPVGQKKLGFVPHTVLLLGKSRAGEYWVSTVKDRGREELENVPIESFAMDYLVKVAGWRPDVAVHQT